MRFIILLGDTVLSAFRETGRICIFLSQSLFLGIQPPYFWRLLLSQMFRIGYLSLPVVALTAFFTGAVLALQIYYGGNQFNSESIIASIVALGITRELGPVLAGLMVAGRVSAAIAAELGTMRVTDQIDALVTLSTNPFKYLVMPRILAAVLALPLLTMVADVIGILGGFAVGVENLGFNPAIYIQNTVDFLDRDDITSGMIKSAVFGFLITSMGCYYGFHSSGGAQGVGRATTSAVVASSILILASNYILTSVFFS